MTNVFPYHMNIVCDMIGAAIPLQTSTYLNNAKQMHMNVFHIV